MPTTNGHPALDALRSACDVSFSLAQDQAVRATSALFAGILEAPAVHTLAQRLEKGGVLSLSGVSPAAQPFCAALLHQLFPKQAILAVTCDLRAQELFQQDLTTWFQQSENPLFYPPWDVLPHETGLPHADVVSERLETLVALTRAQNAATEPSAPLVVTSVTALLQRTLAHGYLEAHTRTVSRGDRIDPLDLVEWLEDQGYEPEAQVSEKGEIALRGGILDIYPLTSPWPVRLDFFGDELESIRQFDPFTQKSLHEIPAIILPPGGELGILRKARAATETAGGNPGPLGSAPAASASTASRGQPVAAGTLLDYLSPDTLLLLFGPEELQNRADDYAAQVPEKHRELFIDWKEFQEQARARGMTLLNVLESDLDPDPSRFPSGDQEDSAAELLLASLDEYRPLSERAPESQVAQEQRRAFFEQLHRWLRQGYQVHVFCNNEGERQRFSEIWSEYGLPAGSEIPAPGAAPLRAAEEGFRGAAAIENVALVLHIGTLSRGFLSEDARLVVVTDAEIFGRYKVQRPRRLKAAHAQTTRSALDIDFAELEEGDYVVHLQHGIGRYLGLQVLPMGAGTKATEGTVAATSGGQECLVLEYAPRDPLQPAPKLYVPVSEAHLVSKYVGTGKARPALNTLGGSRWARAKEQAERAVRDLASDLLAIQAARESQAGYSFDGDTSWQREFEGSFLYEETPDQMKAIVETKNDMERPKPMDRLICGDVGFGKTEVGIRAAFKAVMSGKQVAVLVPTTVLAQQHFNTFRERMADYPVRIELLSRFRTRRAQQKVVRDLAAGSVDIVIGTHRLVQEDVAFKELGLVVIDEEQRFGVLHKEKFKMLRQLVDVLTLSATPIPRTLYLALTGARDMSTIQTPPHDRLPVETIVLQYDERVIRDAIQRELNRGGQVFFLHNRVMTIMTMAQKLAALVPQARIVVGHGQMDSDDLEEVMTTFVNGDADILLSTTIIESGLDIPNANTIIIDRADRFGLSDLYQLRGRVGRYKHQAYAYLLLPRHARLLTDVRKRLSAIKQFSTLGSGFKIAMRDLEIRGAGNLLGAEQSGHITAVGFELYCQLLKQSVASLKGEKVTPRIDVQVRLDFLILSPIEEARRLETPKHRPADALELLQPPEEAPGPAAAPEKDPASAAYIPFAYISDSRQRIEIYRKLAQASEKKALEELEREIRDRFGPLPKAVELLLKVGELKLIAAARGITAIEVKDEKVMLTRQGEYIMVGHKFPRLTKKEAVARLKEIRKLLLAL